MRLDKFLQTMGMFKRREAAKEACEEGRVLVNERIARPAREVLPGQTIEIEVGARRLRVEVVGVPSGNVSKSKRAQFIRVSEEKSTGQ
jgi:ribosomal 50S subunit-recycling heat shock protein